MIAQVSNGGTTVFAAFAVGFVSFISPCVLPLVPGYLSAVSGVSVAEMQSDEPPTAKILWPAAIFCLSFTVIFVALGWTATGLGQTLNDHKVALDKISGALIITMGAVFVASPFIPVLNKEWHPDSLIKRAGSGGPLVAGAAFAVAWTPCIGPTLSSILAAAATSDRGGLLLAFYSLGLAIPFMITAVAFTRATTAWRWLRDRYVIVTAISGAVLIAMGILIFTGELTTLNQKLQGFGPDWIYKL